MSGPERRASSRSAQERHERQDHIEPLRHSHSQGHRSRNIMTMHSSTRRPSVGRHSPRSEPSESSESSSSRYSHPDQEQFFDGQPTRSLNGQSPSYIRTFSRSNSLNGQYDAETTPNIAYINRAASMASNRSWPLRQVNETLEVPGERAAVDIEHTTSRLSQGEDAHFERPDSVGSWPAFPPYRMPRMTPESMGNRGPVDWDELAQSRSESRASSFLDPYDRSEREQEQSIAQVLAAAAEESGPSAVGQSRCNGLTSHSRVNARPFARCGSRQSLHSDVSNPRHNWQYSFPRTGVDGPGEVEEEYLSQGEDVVSEDGRVPVPTNEEIDYFGDSIPIEEEDPNAPPIPPRSPHRDSRSPTPEIGIARAIRLFPTNPDPPSATSTIDSLPLRPQTLPVLHGHPSYRYSEPIEHPTEVYPSPLRQQTLVRQATKTSGTHSEKHSHHSEASRTPVRRKRRFFPIITWKSDGDRRVAGAPAGDGLATRGHHETAPSHWALYLIQAIVWLTLIVWFLVRVSRIENTIPFECYELKTQLLHFNEDMTVSFGNTSMGAVPFVWNLNATFNIPANSTIFSSVDPSVDIQDGTLSSASSILIPWEFHSRLKSRCILHPVNRAVVLASYFEILFTMMLVSCGLAYGLQVFALWWIGRWFRTWLRKSGPQGTGTLVLRLGVQAGSAGVASLAIAAAAWGIKGGWPI